MKIGIIVAMAEELEILKQSLENIKEEKYGSISLYTGNMYNKEVALLLCGIGKVNASVGTTILIDKFNPDFVINSGVAGGFGRTLHTGDIVVSNELIHHDVDVTAFGYEYGQIPDMPLKFMPNKKLQEVVLKSGEELNEISAVSGAIMSGDVFVHTEEHTNSIISNFPQVMACEMEGASVAQTCHIFGVEFVVIRSISDLVFKENSVEGYQFDMKDAADKSAILVKKVLENLED